MCAKKGKTPWNKGTGNGWIDPRGYRQTRVNGKTVREHRVIMEKHLGRKLEPWEHVHHKDGNRLNNDINNLEVLDGAEHTIQHHKGSKRPDQARITMSTIKTMTEEIKRLRITNNEMLEILEQLDLCHGPEDQTSAALAIRAVIAKAKGE